MGFRDDMQQEQIRSLNLRDAMVVRPQTPIRDAVALMKSKSLGVAVIVEYGNIPQGIFTEQSLLRAITDGASLDDTCVGDYPDPHFLSLKITDPVWRVWEAVEKEGLRFICVTDEDGKLMGVTGQRGIAEYVAEYFPQQVVVQRLGSTPWMQQREGA